MQIDIIQMLSPLLAMWWLIPVLLLLSFLKSPKFKGLFGEAVVNRSLEKRLELEDTILLKDILLPTHNGTTQIDHILVHQSGIYVIETKNYSGIIYAQKNRKQWTQAFRSGKKHKFQNPFNQNYKHIKTLSDNCNIPYKNIHNIVIFIGEAKFKNGFIDDLYTSPREFCYKIEGNKNIVIEDIEGVAEKIKAESLKNSLKNKREHNKHVKEIVKNKRK